jgi:hypothetical protein
LHRGWYETAGGGIIGYNGSKHARFVNSGMHYLGPSTDVIPAAPPQPPWVTPDGTVSVAAMPDLVPVDDGSGVKSYVWSADLMGVSDADLPVLDVAGRRIGTCFTEGGNVPQMVRQP